MTRILAALVLSLAIPHVAYAGAQQEKMKSCNKEAKEKALKGDERKKFMSDCLKAGGGEAAEKKEGKAEEKQEAKAEEKKELKPKDSMKACNGAAKDKKGDERKKFMSECLKAKGPDGMAK